MLCCTAQVRYISGIIERSIMIKRYPRALPAILVLLSFLFTVNPAEAQKSKRAGGATKAALSAASRFAPVDAIMKAAVEEKAPPGAVVIVGHNGKIVYRKAFGYRSLEPTHEPMTLDSVFDMASLTKCLATATSITRMLELGQIRLNEPVAKYLPEFAQSGKQDVAVRQLVTHYSGLAPDLDLKEPWQG